MLTRLIKKSPWLVGLCAGLLLWQSPAVHASSVLGMQSPDDVARGGSFKVQVLAPVLEGTVEDLQIYLRYDPQAFTFVKANSRLLETPGSEIPAGDETKARTLSDNGQVITMLAFLQPGSFSGQVLAELEFQSRVDAVIGPVLFSFIENSFITLRGSGRIQATTEQLQMQVLAGEQAQPSQATPLQPLPTAPPTAPPTDPNAPAFDPANVAPSQATVPSDAGAYGVDRALGASAPTAASTPVSMPTSPPSTAPSTAPAQSDLLTVAGERLLVPEGALPVDLIPSGFQGSSMTVNGHMISTARSSEQNLSVYWLAKQGQNDFYTYDFASDRFSLYRKEAPTEASTAAPSARSFTRNQDGSPKLGIVLALSLVCLSSLAVLVYSVLRHVSRR